MCFFSSPSPPPPVIQPASTPQQTVKQVQTDAKKEEVKAVQADATKQGTRSTITAGYRGHLYDEEDTSESLLAPASNKL